MIISVSGKIGSGKDTVGKIIQYLTRVVQYKDLTYEEFCNHVIVNPRTDFQIKKFADTLKDIVCMLINCTKEQLEDQKFKETELNEEWRRWYIFEKCNKGIPISKMFTTELECLEAKQQDPKYTHFGLARLGIEYTYVAMTPRLLLQLLGTQCGRDIIHPNIWINSLMSNYQPNVLNQNRMYIGEEYPASSYPNWIITDMRFQNELKAVKDKGSISIRVNRPISDKIKFKEIGKLIEHESETALDTATFDYEINNSGTIEDLIDKVKQILIKEKLITK